jgi:hypothetical protein
MNIDMINPDDELIQEMKIEDLKKMVEELPFETFMRASVVFDNFEKTELSDESDFSASE